jgi:hypothetical protein
MHSSTKKLAKALSALFALNVLTVAPAMGASADLDLTNSCVMVYVKNDASQPNLTVACDGERVLSHAVRTEDQLENPSAFRAELFSVFKLMVNSSGRKECKEYDYENVWWASCLEKN